MSARRRRQSCTSWWGAHNLRRKRCVHSSAATCIKTCAALIDACTHGHAREANSTTPPPKPPGTTTRLDVPDDEVRRPASLPKLHLTIAYRSDRNTQSLGCGQKSAPGRKQTRYAALRVVRFRTVVACHEPPRAVRMPRAFKASAMVRKPVTPLASICRTIASTLAANAAAAARFASAPFALASARLVAHFGVRPVWRKCPPSQKAAVHRSVGDAAAACAVAVPAVAAPVGRLGDGGAEHAYRRGDDRQEL